MKTLLEISHFLHKTPVIYSHLHKHELQTTNNETLDIAR
jgi:hypothetical protein